MPVRMEEALWVNKPRERRIMESCITAQAGPEWINWCPAKQLTHLQPWDLVPLTASSEAGAEPLQETFGMLSVISKDLPELHTHKDKASGCR